VAIVEGKNLVAMIINHQIWMHPWDPVATKVLKMLTVAAKIQSESRTFCVAVVLASSSP
jgi:hypothetical protein